MGDRYGGLFGERTPCPLDDVYGFLTDYVAFPSEHAAVAVTLWAAHTHLIDQFDSTPRLALLSAEKQSGKTRTMDLLELLCAGAEKLSDASPAYLYRRIDAGQVTVLIDEADAIWRRGRSDDSAEALRSIVNAGHRRGAYIGRVDMAGQKAELVRFGVFAPVALAGIGDLPETIMDRAVIVRMRRRSPDEQVADFRERYTRPEGDDLRERLADWTSVVADRVGDPWPDMPEGVADRPADVWEPLLMVADLAGGDWPQRARAACVAFVMAARDETPSLGVQLLKDLYTIFEPDMPDAIPTETILARLHAMDESPWGDLRGRPLDARRLASILRPYDVRPRHTRFGERTMKGYRREDLWDAWVRYGILHPCPEKTETESTLETSQVTLTSDVSSVTAVSLLQGRERGKDELVCDRCGNPLDPALADVGRHVNC